MSDGMAHSGNHRVVGSGGAGVDVSPEKVGQVLLRLFRLFRVLRMSSKKGILKKAGLRAGLFCVLIDDPLSSVYNKTAQKF